MIAVANLLFGLHALVLGVAAVTVSLCPGVSRDSATDPASPGQTPMSVPRDIRVPSLDTASMDTAPEAVRPGEIGPSVHGLSMDVWRWTT